MYGIQQKTTSNAKRIKTQCEETEQAKEHNSDVIDMLDYQTRNVKQS